MSEAIRNIPTPHEIVIGSKKYVKYGISPIKLAQLYADEHQTVEKQTPIMEDGVEYVYNSRGKLVRLERFDPDTMEEFFLSPDAKLTPEQQKQLMDAASRPISFDEDCPESTPEQLERFRKFAQERNRRRAELERAQLNAKQS